MLVKNIKVTVTDWLILIYGSKELNFKVLLMSTESEWYCKNLSHKVLLNFIMLFSQLSGLQYVPHFMFYWHTHFLGNPKKKKESRPQNCNNRWQKTTGQWGCYDSWSRTMIVVLYWHFILYFIQNTLKKLSVNTIQGIEEVRYCIDWIDTWLVLFVEYWTVVLRLWE